MERYVIHVTKECNMDCLYCYEKDKTSVYTWEEIKEFIDTLIELRTSDEFGVEFLGGEPMLAWEYIVKAYEYLESMKEVEIPDYVITTNGTILEPEMLDYLFKNQKITYAVSLDGHEYANQLRVFKESRKNSYKSAISNIKKLTEKGAKVGVHMVTHPYNVAMIDKSIEILYREGVRSMNIGTVESTMQIDKAYCDRFIKELDLVSEKIAKGLYPNLSVAELTYVKPKSDVRSYIRDKSGKVVAESYGRSGEDITQKESKFDIQRCTEDTKTSEMIYNIRKTVFDNHQKRLNK